MSTKLSRRDFLKGVGTLGMAGIVANQPCLQFLPRILNDSVLGVPNLITVMFDTLRYDHVGFHGNEWIQTPNIDAFAGQSIVFNRAYSGGFPTVLNRAEFFSGQFMYPIINWEDLPPETPVGVSALNEVDYSTGLVFDNWHLKDEGFYLDRNFRSWDWVRGQEGDRLRANPPHPPLPASPEKFRNVAKIEQYLRNVADRQQESDYLVARTLQRAVEWLERNDNYMPFYLHVDAFDPHEPWDPPQSYVELYDPGYSGEEVIYPAYAPPSYMNADELNHMRALYAAEVTLVDSWFGYFLSELDRLNLTDSTIVIMTSDHGFMLGEHDAVGKAWSVPSYYEAYPLYQELVHVPLMVRVPGATPRQVDALAQPADFMPTLIDYAGGDVPDEMHGVSLRPILEESATSVRDVAVSGRSLQLSLSTKNRLTVTDGEWTLFHGAAHASSHLYYLPDDPGQQNDLIGSNCATAQALHTQLLDFLSSINVPADVYSDWEPAPC